MRLIDADALMEYTQNQILKSIECNDIARFPTIEAEPVKHGWWVEKQLDNFRKIELQCSMCGWRGVDNYDSYVDIACFDYCPSCGAKMDAEG